MRDIPDDVGLHQLAGWFRLTFFAEQCEMVLGKLDLLIEEYSGRCAMSPKELRLDRPPMGSRSPADEEAQWERAIYTRFGPHRSDDAVSFLPECPFVQTYQFPLKRRQGDRHWGEVDLLGIGPDNLPVVVELKKRHTRDTPLRMITEAAAYGIAMRETWPWLRGDWQRCLESRLGIAVHMPEHLQKPRLVGLAPTEYWDLCLGRSGRAGQVPAGGWSPFWRLIDALSESFTIDFAVVHGSWADGRLSVTHADAIDVRLATGC